ncbi:MAG: mercury(II) reductase [Calditrichaeota bacterium]|nr:mercury(II) reductase [Calditrichota bacterium]
MDCCQTKPHFLIIGGGSAAFSAAIQAIELGARVTVINAGLPVGGTCVNVGCVPSKTLIRAAEGLYRAQTQRFAGIHTQGRLTDFSALIEQKNQLIANLRQTKYLNILKDSPDFQLVEARARFVDARTVEANGQRFTADKILIATGARTRIPNIKGLDKVKYLTNETAYQLSNVPESLIILGGNFIGLENAQLFARLGSRVTVVEMLPRILPAEEPEIAEEITRQFQEEGIRVITGARVHAVTQAGDRVTLELEVGKQVQQITAKSLWIATGRHPNTDSLNLENTAVQRDENDFIQVNDYLETHDPNIFAAGDVIGDPMFVYTAAYEGKLAAINALSPERRPRRYDPLPWVVFTDPQVAGVGMDETRARKEEFEAQSVTLPLSEVPRALAARDTRGFIRLVRDVKTDRLLGARIVAPEAGELVMMLSLAIMEKWTVKQLSEMLFPYLTLSEGIKLAALSFYKDVHALSCCAG